MKKFPVISPKTMYSLDEQTIKVQKITAEALLMRAGKALTLTLLKTLRFDSDSNHVLCLIGPGMNGGDALVMANELHQRGHTISLFLASKKLVKASQTMVEQLDQSIRVITDLESLKASLDNVQYVIDGLFGIGLNKMISAPYDKIIDTINEAKKYVISIDIPSGINGQSGLKMNQAIRADLTLIIGHYKTGNVLQDAKDYHGKKALVDIGLEPLDNHHQFLVHDGYFKHIQIERKHHSHKYDYGALLTIGGAHGMMGAPYLTAVSALRMGVGLSVTLYHHEDYHERFQLHPEIMAFRYHNIHDLSEHLIKKNAIVFGPGLGRNQPENTQILEFLLETSRPLVIDADGLFYFKKYINQSVTQPVILTPHMGEMARLFDLPVETIKANPLDYISKLTDKGYIVLLKGPTSILADKNEVLLSSFGTPALATPGSGDVLSGMIGALLARKLNPIEAVNFALYIHSQAGLTAGIKEGVESVLASDLIHWFPQILARFNRRKD